MGFIIKIFCFLLVLNYITMELFVEFTFDAIPLGHSGLLIIWKPNIKTQSEETLIKHEYLFKFENYIIGEKNNENHKSVDNQSHSSAEKINEDYNELEDNENYSSAGQHKIHSLNENTLYNVTIKQYSKKNVTTLLKEYSLEKRTNLKSKRLPAKPYFKYEDTFDGFGSIRIRWYPCGKERICNDKESGTHFGLRIKEPYSTMKWKEINKEEFCKDYINIIFWPGTLYEVLIYSINGDYKTDSDCQEIFVQPSFTPVQYVSIISLPDLSALISWKPPKQAANKLLRSYSLYYFNFSDPDVNLENRILFWYKKHGSSINGQTITSLYEQIRIFDLKPEVIYTYFIFPVAEDGLGFPYRNKMKFHMYDRDLPIARPDFNYKFERFNKTCIFYFQWLPCGQSFNCKNTKPGSNYTFHIEPQPIEEENGQIVGYWIGTVRLDVVYHVTVKSAIGNNFSEPETKIFKNCKEIRENIYLGKGN